jgi:hypothetical protein
MSYLFLKTSDHNEQLQNPTWFAVSEDRIEVMSVSVSYDDYGQKISASDAGDYLEILSQKAAEIANIEWNDQDAEGDDFVKKFKVGDTISAYERTLEFDAILSLCEEGVDYKLEETQFSGFNYHDGHKWQTISVDSIDDNNSHEIEEDEEIIARLNAALENAEFESEGFGIETRRHEDAVVTYSQFQSAWEYATITFDEQD